MHLVRSGAMRFFKTQISTRAVCESQCESQGRYVSFFESLQAFLLFLFELMKVDENKDHELCDIWS